VYMLRSLASGFRRDRGSERESREGDWFRRDHERRDVAARGRVWGAQD
jgi:hypothetical protein